MYYMEKELLGDLSVKIIDLNITIMYNEIGDVYMKNGKFIVFEGIDGSGKSTQIKLLAEKLSERGEQCHLTLEPTYGMVGTLVHDILSKKIKADPKVTAGLFVADRLDHLMNDNDGIVKMVREGKTVLCDRYYFSSYAYQGSEVPLEWVIDANRLCADTMRADYTIFIDVSPEAAMDRINKNRDETELFENVEKLTAVRNAYLAAFDMMRNRENILIINGDQSIEKVAEDIEKAIL